MRVRAGLTLGILLLCGTATAACGGGGDGDGGGSDQVASVDSGKPGGTSGGSGGSSGSSSGGAGGEKTAADFAKCMRENGLPEFPDPEANGSMVLPEGVDKAKVDAAQAKCKDRMPDGGERPEMSAQDLEKAKQFARCMRENGVADFPDPDPQGGMGMSQGDGLDPEAPAFKSAQQQCSQHMPAGPGGKAPGDNGSGDKATGDKG